MHDWRSLSHVRWGLDEETIRRYIREQDELQRRKGEADQGQFDFE